MYQKIILRYIAFLLTIAASTSYAHNDKSDHHHSAQESHSSHHEHNAEPTIKLSIHKIENKDGKKLVQIKLFRIKDDKPISPDDLKEVHTQKVHLLIIDDSLIDYHHIHPKALAEPGLYEFVWEPKTQGNYRIWADLCPVNTNTQEYVIADLVAGKEANPEINQATVLESVIDGYTFKLSFDSDNLVTGTPVIGKITVTDAKGNPVTKLEPVMGAFAHIVGFADDMQTVVHIHPMGEEPSKSTDRGGPELQFHIEPAKAGFIKLFVQVSVNGKELFVPFGITVK